MPLAEQFPDLTSLYGVGPLSGYLGGQQIDAARRSQQINQQGALQDLFQKEQMLPVDMEYKRALTGQSRASTEHMGEQTRGLKFKNEMDDKTREEQYRANLSKLMKETSEDELKSQEAQIWTMYNSGVPHLRKAVEPLIPLMKDIATEREKQKSMMDRQLELENTRAENQRVTASARVATKQQGESALQKALVSRDPMQVANAYDRLAQVEEDPVKQQYYALKAQEYRQLAQDRPVPGQPAPGKIDPAATAQQGAVVAVPPRPPAQPPVLPGQQPQQQSKPMSYTSPDAVKEAFKSGKLSREQAKQILQSQFGMQ